MIWHTRKLIRSHFNDTNGRSDLRKIHLEVILMIQTEDTTYKKASGLYFNHKKGRLKEKNVLY